MIRNSLCNGNKIRRLGMTLIELLIVVSIISLLAAIAYPSYSKHVLKGHRTNALADMAKIQLTLEHNYDNGYNWSQIMSGGTCLICDSDSERYLFAVASSAPHAYIITATAQVTKGQDKDPCLLSDKKMILTANNEAEPKACWK
ncbi:fimbrial protein [Vibrio alginolyticus]|nr:fimbrial protein [Vibrio alginolyticus]